MAEPTPSSAGVRSVERALTLLDHGQPEVVDALRRAATGMGDVLAGR